jgi:hypothetical protein
MSDNLSIGGVSPLLTNGRFAPNYPANQSLPVPDVQGVVAVTRFSGSMRRIVERSSMRQARVRAIQSEIENGNYETLERISGTVDRLLDVIA